MKRICVSGMLRRIKLNRVVLGKVKDCGRAWGQGMLEGKRRFRRAEGGTQSRERGLLE